MIWWTRHPPDQTPIPRAIVPEPKRVRFVSIAARPDTEDTRGALFAVDDRGRVWRNLHDGCGYEGWELFAQQPPLEPDAD